MKENVRGYITYCSFRPRRRPGKAHKDLSIAASSVFHRIFVLQCSLDGGCAFTLVYPHRNLVTIPNKEGQSIAFLQGHFTKPATNSTFMKDVELPGDRQRSGTRTGRS